jgi:hypothetical protein
MVDEDDLREMRREVEEIRDEVADMSHIQSLQVRADGRVESLVLRYFESGATETKVAIYLAVDGKRSSAEIADEVGRHAAQVTRYGNQMIERGILGVSWVNGRKVLRYTRLERTIHLRRRLQALADD